MVQNNSDIWGMVVAMKAEQAERPPLSRQDRAALDAWYDVELTYTSCALEGNSLTRREVDLLFNAATPALGKPLRDQLEVQDHREALRYARLLASQRDPIRETDIRELHRLVLNITKPDLAGRYSTTQRHIQGSNTRLPGPLDIAPMMQAFGQWLGQTDAHPHNAVTAHTRLVEIHPFDDGNGRTARLLMNLMLMRTGYPPIIITPEQRPDYLAGLEARHADGEPEALDRFMVERLKEGLRRVLR